MDKVSLAKQHPGNGCTGAGETDWADLFEIDGCMGLTARQAWYKRVISAATLDEGSMKSLDADWQWIKIFVQIISDEVPLLHAANGATR